MPATFVVDASVIVEFLVPGGRGAAAGRFMGGLAWAEPLDLFAPDMILLEVGNVVRKLALAGLVAHPIADELVARLPELAIAKVESGALLSGAWALRHNMTIFDASYATLARELSVPLVTTDAKLARACRSADIRAFEVDDPELDAILAMFEPTSG